MIALPMVGMAGVLGVAVVWDVARRRIPNACILVGLALAVAWHAFGAPGSWSFDPARPGAAGIGGSLMGAAILLAVFLPFYALRIMGAGDVKLMAVVGAWYGAHAGAWGQLMGATLFVLAAGGVLSVARMLAGGSWRSVLVNLRLIIAGVEARASGRPGPRFDARTDSADRMPFALAIAAGAIAYAVAKSTGWIEVP